MADELPIPLTRSAVVARWGQVERIDLAVRWGTLAVRKVRAGRDRRLLDDMVAAMRAFRGNPEGGPEQRAFESRYALVGKRFDQLDASVGQDSKLASALAAVGLAADVCEVNLEPMWLDGLARRLEELGYAPEQLWVDVLTGHVDGALLDFAAAIAAGGFCGTVEELEVIAGSV